MRNIKFRGKTGTTEGKKWVYGYLYKIKSFFSEDYQYFIKNEHLQETSVDEDTIGQYTGLKDRNMKEIYEGDIIQYKDITKGLIRYSEKYAQYVLVNTGTVKDEFEPLGDYNMEVFEIIGNEFDNPELLGKENKDE